MQTYLEKLDVSTLRNFIHDHITQYPVTAENIVEQAEAVNMLRGVADFYKHFPAETSFKNEDELLARTEQIVLLEDGGASNKRIPNYEEFDTY
jgi:hypothetical protein